MRIHVGPARGFSLIELVIVFAIVGVVAAIAVPRYAGAVGRHRADAAAQRIVADLGLARDEARYYSQARTVKFEVLPNRLWIPDGGDLNHQSNDYSVELDETPYQAQLVSADFGGAPDVNFDGYGKPSSGGMVVVEAGGTQRTVVLDAETGVATIQ